MNQNLDNQKFQDPGTGVNYSKRINRLFKSDGSFNVKKVGLGMGTAGTYHTLINLSWASYILFVFGFLIIINSFFAVIYLMLGVHTFGLVSLSIWIDLLNSFYFSVQTFTTVGYGGMSPIGNLPNLIASFEMLVGVICMAITTGVTYGKFSRPTAKILFSKHAIVSPYKKGKALMFRIANQRSTQLIEVNAQVTLSWEQKDGDTYKRKYHRLELERDHIMFFPLTWTVVHPIDQKSPLNNFSKEDFKSNHVEFLVLISGYDDTFNQTVYQKYSYTANQILTDVKFVKPYYVNDNNQVIFDVQKTHQHTLI